MALNDYIIKYSSTDDTSTAGAYSKPSIVVSERSSNKTTTSLTLFGKYSISYGEDLQTNLVRMLENFARDTAPSNPTVGQLWFDTKTKLLKVYTPTSTGSIWNSVGGGVSGSGGGSSTLAIATISSLGGIMVGSPFAISSSGVLSLPDFVYTEAVTATKTPAEYTIGSNINFVGNIYSTDSDNYIAPTASKPASAFNKYFITKHYADTHYIATGAGATVPTWIPTITPTKGVLVYDGTNAIWSKAGTANQVLTCTDNSGTVSWTTVTGGGTLPISTGVTLGGVRVQRPFIANGLGDLSLEDVAFRFYTPATATDPSIPSQYDFTANIKATGDAYSSTPDNHIGADPLRAATDYDPYFVTKHYADTHYAALVAGGGTLAIATSSVLGGIKVGTPFNIDNTGVLSLTNVAYDATKSEYSVGSYLKLTQPQYSSDQDGFTDADNSKPSTFYDAYYITKHYADSRYAKASGGSGGSGYVLPTASTSTLGGFKVGDPLSISATGVLTLPKLTYDSTSSTYTYAAAVQFSDSIYSLDANNKVDSDTKKPSNFYDAYFITKSYADGRYAKISAGSTGSSSGTLSIANATAIGGIMIANPFAVSNTGVLSLQHVTFTDAVAANASATPPVVAAPAEYVIDAAIKSAKWLYSDDTDNTIGLDVSKNYDKYFITKHYADAHYAAIGGGGSGGTTNPYTLPAATTSALGGIKVGAPFDMSATGVLSLPMVTFTAAVAANASATPPVSAKSAEYNITAAVKTGEIIYSANVDNKIFGDSSKAEADYDSYFVTKHFADHNYAKLSSVYTLPPATATTLGGVKVSAPLDVDAGGSITIPYLTLNNTNKQYDFAANIQTKLSIYSLDADNNINKVAGKAPADYDTFFITKHFADTHYAVIGATPANPTGLTVSEPLILTGTALSIRKLTYDSAHDEHQVSANLKTLANAYSSNLDNNIGTAAGVPAADFDYYFTTKHYTDNNYLRLGTTFDGTSTAKSKNVIEYATGFNVSNLSGKDNALVTKKYVDDKTIGATTATTFADKSVIFASSGFLAEDVKFGYNSTDHVLNVSNIVLESITTNKTAAVTVYNPTASATSGASINLFSSPVPVTPAITKPANASGTLLGSVKFGGWDSANPYIGATIDAYSSELWTGTAHGCNLVISVTKNGEKDPVPALVVNNDNSISVPGGIVETIFSASGTTWTLDLSKGSMQILPTTGNTTITMPSVSSFTGKSITMIVKYGGSHTLTWAGTAISWDSDFVPVPTSLAGKTDIFSFFGDGTKIYGVCGGQAFP